MKYQKLSSDQKYVSEKWNTPNRKYGVILKLEMFSIIQIKKKQYLMRDMVIMTRKGLKEISQNWNPKAHLDPKGTGVKRVVGGWTTVVNY